MNRFTKIAGIAALTASVALMPIAQAGPVENFSNCLISSTSEKDRLDLIRWIYGAMSVHPAIEDMSNVSAAAKEDNNKNLANVFERLMVKDCKTEFRALALSGNAEEGIEAAFAYLGEVAMMDLMQNNAVLESLEAYTEYLDEATFMEAMMTP